MNVGRADTHMANGGQGNESAVESFPTALALSNFHWLWLGPNSMYIYEYIHIFVSVYAKAYMNTTVRICTCVSAYVVRY